MLLTIAILLIPLLLCICVPFRYLVNQEWPRLRRALYFPIAGQARWEHRTQRVRLLRRFGGVELKLRTADERDVHCVWIEYRGDLEGGGGGGEDTSPCETPVALCLHANAMVLDDMIDWAQFYLSRGVSVMLVTFWGYPDPNDPDDLDEQPAGLAPELQDSLAGGVDATLLGSGVEGEVVRCPSEQTMYHDAEAALRYIHEVKRVATDRTLAHGLSIGGGVAASLGVQHPGLRVTFDQTFASLHEVSVHVGAGLYDQLILPRAPRRCHMVTALSRTSARSQPSSPQQALGVNVGARVTASALISAAGRRTPPRFWSCCPSHRLGREREGERRERDPPPSLPPLVLQVARCLQPVILRLAAFVLVRMLFKTGRRTKYLCEQDRMDNLRKASTIKGDVFAIWSEVRSSSRPVSPPPTRPWLSRPPSPPQWAHGTPPTPAPPL